MNTQRHEVRQKYEDILSDYHRRTQQQRDRWEESLAKARKKVQALITAKKQHDHAAHTPNRQDNQRAGDLLSQGFRVVQGAHVEQRVMQLREAGHRIQNDPRVSARVTSIFAQN